MNERINALPRGNAPLVLVTVDFSGEGLNEFELKKQLVSHALTLFLLSSLVGAGLRLNN